MKIKKTVSSEKVKDKLKKQNKRKKHQSKEIEKHSSAAFSNGNDKVNTKSKPIDKQKKTNKHVKESQESEKNGSDAFIDKNEKVLNGKSNKQKKPKKKQLKQSEKNTSDSETIESGNQNNSKKELKKKKNKKFKSSESKTKKKSTLADHKNDIEKLKDIDPEFYKFLKNNDKELIDFNWDSSDDEENSENDITHKPPEKLEVASDDDVSDSEIDKETDNDSDFSVEKETIESNVITFKQIRNWQNDLETKFSIETIRNVMQALNSALASITEDNPNCTYKVEGSAIFNGIVQLCVLYLQKAIHKYVGYNGKIPIYKTKKWPKLRNSLRFYFMDLIRLIEQVSSADLLSALLKHLHVMSDVLDSFPTISKPILKRLILLWSTAEDSTRVLSFLCIVKITRNQQKGLLSHVLKAMYLSYVRNSKFVNPNSLPNINFMRRSLVEMFALDLNVAYQHAFLYIRQLAIHLRNAIVLKKKDSAQAVYNWQFINSIRLWSDLLGIAGDRSQLQLLIYPLINVTIGVIRLISTAQYFPLRFHCIQSMISLLKRTNIFIPLLPYIIEVLNSNIFQKKHTIVSMKPMEFTCILRLNKAQLAENGFRDEVIDQVCSLTLEYLEHFSSSLAYCDLIVPLVFTLKKYKKGCKNANHSRKLKQILDKIQENSKYIEIERQKVNFGLNDIQLIKAWEANIYAKQTPLSIYYKSWAKTHETKKKRQAARTDDINDYGLPVIKKRKLKQNDKAGTSELFPSDDENDDMNLFGKEDEVERSEPPKKKRNKKKTITEIVASNEEMADKDDNEFIDNAVDIVEDLDIDDW